MGVCGAALPRALPPHTHTLIINLQRWLLTREAATRSHGRALPAPRCVPTPTFAPSQERAGSHSISTLDTFPGSQGTNNPSPRACRMVLGAANPLHWLPRGLGHAGTDPASRLALPRCRHAIPALCTAKTTPPPFGVGNSAPPPQLLGSSWSPGPCLAESRGPFLPPVPPRAKAKGATGGVRHDVGCCRPIAMATAWWARRRAPPPAFRDLLGTNGKVGLCSQGFQGRFII